MTVQWLIIEEKEVLSAVNVLVMPIEETMA